MRTIENIAVVDHLSDETDFERRFGRGEPVAEARPEKDRLARVGVGAPFVENEGTQEIGPVSYLGQERVGDKIVDGLPQGVPRKQRAEVPTGNMARCVEPR